MNWKRTFAFLVMALFLLSVPAVFADNQDRVIARTGEQAVDGAVQLNESAAEGAEPNLIAPASAAIKAAKDKFEAAKEQYEAARERYQEAKQSIEQNREKVKECKEETTETCTTLVKEVKKDVKNFLLGAADRIIAALEKVQSKITESSMAEEKKTELLANIDERVASVETAKESINALTETSTKAEIKEVTAELKDAWKGARAELKIGVGRLANEKIHGVIVKSEQLKTKLETTITKLSEQGYDVSGIEELKASFDGKLADAKTHYDAAVAIYAQEVVPGEVDELMKDANAEMKAAQESLKEAHQILKEIVDEIKDVQEKEVEEEEETEETPENETEED